MSVPRPLPVRRPIWQLVFGLSGLLVAILWLVEATGHSEGNGFRLFMVVLWAGLGLVWIALWRRAVKKHASSGDGTDSSQ